jgi:cysteine synthase
MMTAIATSTARNVYAGSAGLNDFLNPGMQPPTPMVELTASLNPFHQDGVRVFLKLLFMTPIFNSKILASRNLLEEAQRDGQLRGVHTLVENSSGNKILADAVLARHFGIEHVVAIVPRDIPADKQQLLELFGVQCLKESGGVAKARELGEQDGWWNPAQYDSAGNPGGSELWLGPQIFEQTCGEITLLCAGVGTGGTIIGAHHFLRRHALQLTTIGVIPPTDDVPGVRTLKRLAEVNLPWRSVLSEDPVIVDVIPAFMHSLRLSSRGILAGPSSGMALAGLFKYLEGKQGNGGFDSLKNDSGEVIAVVPCPDSCMLYLNKYTTRLNGDELAAAIAP